MRNAGRQQEGEEEDTLRVDDVVICSKHDPGAVACASVMVGSPCFRFWFSSKALQELLVLSDSSPTSVQRGEDGL